MTKKHKISREDLYDLAIIRKRMKEKAIPYKTFLEKLAAGAMLEHKNGKTKVLNPKKLLTGS